MNKHLFYYLAIGCILVMGITACGSDDTPEPSNENLYFPPLTGSTWESLTPQNLGWNTDKIPALLTFLENNNTRAFILLKDGKIVMEHYFGTTFSGATFTANSNWYWASAGKTLTAFMVGIAQEENYLSLQDPTSNYLGQGWTSLTPTQENAITVWHQLTMTTGLDDGVANPDCTEPECLTYLATPSTRWAYHNAPYTLLDNVVEGAVSKDFDAYFDEKLANKIGMVGFWNYIDFNHVYFSTPRSMARFGLLILNKGKWQEEAVMTDLDFFEEMTNTSQNLNQSYGYLWWLNGKASFKVPSLQTTFQGSIAPNAPSDMIAAMGRDGQLLNVIPSKGLVMVRMGDTPDNSLVPFTFQDEIWGRINEIID